MVQQSKDDPWLTHPKFLMKRRCVRSGAAFAFTPANGAREGLIGYPTAFSEAVVGLLDLAQRQVGADTNTQGWLPVPVIEYVAGLLDMHPSCAPL